MSHQRLAQPYCPCRRPPPSTGGLPTCPIPTSAARTIPVADVPYRAVRRQGCAAIGHTPARKLHAQPPLWTTTARGHSGIA
eukprot:769575-Pyramimonas_sp.AAC.1